MKSEKRLVMTFVNLMLVLTMLFTALCGCSNTKVNDYINLNPDDIDDKTTNSLTQGIDDHASKDSGSSASADNTVSIPNDGVTSDGYSQNPTETPNVSSSDLFGNTAGNLHNGGFVAIEEEWIYYSTASGLYKIHNNGSTPELLLDQQVTYINVGNGWIYCNQNGSLVKMRANGTSVTTLANNVMDIVLYGNYLYFVDSESLYLYQMRVDGSDKVLLISECMHNLCITEDGIFWGTDTNTFCSDLSGQNLQRYFGAAGQELLMYKGYKYSSGRLIKEKIDGSDNSTLVFSGTAQINIAYDWVFYININNNRSIYKIRTDGTDFIQVTTQNCVQFNVVGDWIYYTANKTTPSHSSTTVSHYRMRLDGSNVKLLN